MKRKSLLLCALTGALLALSFPSVDFEFLAWFALVPFFYAIAGKGLKASFGHGFLAGFLFYLGTLYWIIIAVHAYGHIPLFMSGFILLLLVGYLGVYFGTFAAFIRLFDARLGPRSVFLAPLLWVFLEYVRSFLLTGFPWANLGYSQYLNLPFIQMADLAGVYGLSFVIVLVNVTLYWMLRQGSLKRIPYPAVAVAVALVLASMMYGHARMRAVDRQVSRQPALKVGLVQGNIDQSIKWDESFQKETLKIYERLSIKVAEERTDLIIWPETATPFFFQEAKEHQPLVLNIPRETRSFLLFGSPSYTVEKAKVNHFNSAYLVSPAGVITGKYDKIHLVPFGEYVPLSGLLFFLGSLGEGIGDFKSGREVYNFRLPDAKFGVLICFEIIFPNLCRQFVDRDADFLVTITNDAWFGRTSAPYQHLAIATFRAVENRVFVARAANTGISAFIDPKGKILNQGGIFTEESMNGTVRLMREKTFYTRYGDVFAWVCSAVSLLLLGYALVRTKSPVPRS